MRRGRKRQDGGSATMPRIILPPKSTEGALDSIFTTTMTLSSLSTYTDVGGVRVTTAQEVTTTAVISAEAAPFISAIQPSTTFSSSTSTSSPSSVQTSPPAQTSTPPAQGIPLNLIPAIVVPIVVVALAAPIALYFFLTRHDRQRRKSRTALQTSTRACPDTRIEYKKHDFTNSSLRAGASEASGIMSFDLGPAAEKPLPVVNVGQLPDYAFERPDSFQVVRGLDPGIGQAVSRYSIGKDSFGKIADASQRRTSIQELSEENMRIARLATDSRASFGTRGLDEVSDMSARERTSRQVERRSVDELSNVSSFYENETAASSDRGGGILGNYGARRSGPLR
ncbi:hypothetical protein GJ744_009884 [Endocarpon pusillum]|uniref:Uncharacterized protein n=1 Tax=Endocarpon pusillum TaxID=364733 RepID=A0A8H7E3G7_9EURO|nr:hypothetical protein GJ744_009884 [Endocarpon pusillum]